MIIMTKMRGVELSWESCGGKFGGSFEVDSSTVCPWWMDVDWREMVGMDVISVCLFVLGGQFIIRKKIPFWAFLGGEWLRESWCWVFCTLFHGSETAKNKKRQIITLRSHLLNSFFLVKKDVLFIKGTPQWYFPVMGFPSDPRYPVPQCYGCLLREMPHADPDEDSFSERVMFFFQFEVFSKRNKGPKQGLNSELLLLKHR